MGGHLFVSRQEVQVAACAWEDAASCPLSLGGSSLGQGVVGAGCGGSRAVGCAWGAPPPTRHGAPRCRAARYFWDLRTGKRRGESEYVDKRALFAAACFVEHEGSAGAVVRASDGRLQHVMEVRGCCGLGMLWVGLWGGHRRCLLLVELGKEWGRCLWGGSEWWRWRWCCCCCSQALHSLLPALVGHSDLEHLCPWCVQGRVAYEVAGPRSLHRACMAMLGGDRVLVTTDEAGEAGACGGACAPFRCLQGQSRRGQWWELCRRLAAPLHLSCTWAVALSRAGQGNKHVCTPTGCNPLLRAGSLLSYPWPGCFPAPPGMAQFSESQVRAMRRCGAAVPPAHRTALRCRRCMHPDLKPTVPPADRCLATRHHGWQLASPPATHAIMPPPPLLPRHTASTHQPRAPSPTW